MKEKYTFKAWTSNQAYEKGQEPFFTKEFNDHTEMKIFSANHSEKYKKIHKDYVSDYTKKTTV